MALINCKNCGKPVSDRAVRCPHCGASLKQEADGQAQAESALTSTQPRPKENEFLSDEENLRLGARRRTSRLPVILIIIALLLCCGAGGWYYFSHRDTGEESAEGLSVEQLTKKAKKGKAWAQYALGMRYHEGEGVEQDYYEAVKWWSKAAEQGHVEAQYNLATCYGAGEGVKQDHAEAVKWFTKAAEQGHCDSQYILGVYYYYGGGGVEEDNDEAFKWFTKAAEQDNADAQYYLGECYYYGYGVEEDNDEAFKWFTKSAEQGDAHAQRNLGMYYYYGEGVEQDTEEAVKWFTKSAEQGDAEAQKMLELCSHQINGHEWVDLGLSVKWATCNVGASSPEEYGNYYAWGETSTKSSYTEDNCRTYGKSTGDIAGNSSYDAARANWGGSWRLPMRSEIDELDNRCITTWTTMNGVKGRKVTGLNGNSIFLPAAGFRLGTSLRDAGEGGYYWSATPDGSFTYCAYGLLFGGGSFYLWDWCSRLRGQSVRPVSE